MKYRVKGADRETGQDVEVVVIAESIQVASEKANKMGILAAECLPYTETNDLPDGNPPSRPKREVMCPGCGEVADISPDGRRGRCWVCNHVFDAANPRPKAAEPPTADGPPSLDDLQLQCPDCGGMFDCALMDQSGLCKRCAVHSAAAATMMAPQQTAPNEVILPYSPAKAIQKVANAINSLGTVKETNLAQSTVTGVIKYGFQSVKMRVSVPPAGPNQSRVVIQASGDDVWGAGARNATQRLQDMLRNLDNPGYRPDRRGIHPLAMAGSLVLIVILVILVNQQVSKLFHGSRDGDVNGSSPAAEQGKLAGDKDAARARWKEAINATISNDPLLETVFVDGDAPSMKSAIEDGDFEYPRVKVRQLLLLDRITISQKRHLTAFIEEAERTRP